MSYLSSLIMPLKRPKVIKTPNPRILKVVRAIRYTDKLTRHLISSRRVCTEVDRDSRLLSLLPVSFKS